MEQIELNFQRYLGLPKKYVKIILIYFYLLSVSIYVYINPSCRCNG